MADSKLWPFAPQVRPDEGEFLRCGCEHFWRNVEEVVRLQPLLPTDTRGKPRFDDPRLFAGSFIWLSLVIIELIWTTSGVFELLGKIIWIVFILEFLLRFALAPRKIPWTHHPDERHQLSTALP